MSADQASPRALPARRFAKANAEPCGYLYPDSDDPRACTSRSLFEVVRALSAVVPVAAIPLAVPIQVRYRAPEEEPDKTKYAVRLGAFWNSNASEVEQKAGISPAVS